MTPSRRLLLAAMPLLAATLPRSLRAQSWPERPIRLVVPFAPGGNADLVGRAVGQLLGERLRQTVIVENRAGAGGSVGAEVVARSPADGYTLLVGSNGPLTVNPLVQARLGYDPLTSFRPIGLANRVVHVLVVGPGLRVATVAEFVARSRTASAGVGTPGIGSAAHLTLELFNAASGAGATHIPYRSGGALVPDLVGGNLPAAMVELSSVLPVHREGKVRILAVAGAARAPQAPEVPTLAEAGVPGVIASSYVGVLAPAGIPAAVEQALAAALASALADPGLRERFEASGGELVTGVETTPDGFAAFLRAEAATARRAAELAGLKPE